MIGKEVRVCRNHEVIAKGYLVGIKIESGTGKIILNRKGTRNAIEVDNVIEYWSNLLGMSMTCKTGEYFNIE